MDLNSLTVENETVIDSLPTETVPLEPAPAAEAPAAEPAPETTPQDPWEAAGLDPRELAELAEYAPVLRQIRDGAYTDPAQQQEPEGPPEFDPFDPASVRARDEWLIGQMEQRFQAAMQPFQQQQEMQAQEQRSAAAQDFIQSVLDDDIARNGDFIDPRSKELSELLAGQLLPDLMNRYGSDERGMWRAGEAAISQAAAQMREHDQKVGAAAVERYKNELGTLAGARSEPGRGAAAATEAAPQYKDEMEAMRAYQARTQAA